ncbi:uncharacterized protein PgNI_08645 [Pyricularia grisea]|uniref:Uncharacterized protein n=1 Tax=Pyricularia grisea TaxID=148305 RepID=A0A6P8AVB3_PYRGI|nr:uncharacterized protein PgNI_08645 [Pyricularia grisea]TLD06163.1 hypothetical protein PgNI_08645 [Pyricularia grisea]
MPSSTDSSPSRSSSPPSPTTPDPRRPLLPRTVTQPLPRGVPLRYAWRGKMTWPLRGDPRRYSTFPPYTDGNPFIVFGRNAISWLVVAFWWLAAVLKMTVWNFPAGLIVGLFAGVILCKHSNIKVLQRKYKGPSVRVASGLFRVHDTNLSQIKANTLSPLQPSVPIVLSYGAKDGSVFVQSSGGVVDQAWQSIGANMRNIVVQDEEIFPGLDLNKSHVQVAKHYGGGYVLELEAFRNIRCLNVLRQSLFFNARQYHKPVADFQLQKEVRAEVGKTILTSPTDVCLETLRQQLMCLANGSAHGFVWVDQTSKHIAPDINSNHRFCYAFDKIRLWAESRQVPMTLPKDYYHLNTGDN